MIHWPRGPSVGEIRAKHNLASARLRNQMPQTFGSEYHRVKIQVPKVFARMLLRRFATARGGNLIKTRLRAPNVGRQIAARMRATNPEARVPIERALPD